MAMRDYTIKQFMESNTANSSATVSCLHHTGSHRRPLPVVLLSPMTSADLSLSISLIRTALVPFRSSLVLVVLAYPPVKNTPAGLPCSYRLSVHTYVNLLPYELTIKSPSPRLVRTIEITAPSSDDLHCLKKALDWSLNGRLIGQLCHQPPKVSTTAKYPSRLRFGITTCPNIGNIPNHTLSPIPCSRACLLSQLELS